MKARSKRTLAVAAGAVAVAALAAATAAAKVGWSSVPSPQPKAVGLTSPNVLSPQIREIAVAQGSVPLENPGGGAGWYGYDADGNPLIPAPGSSTEAHKTEPDKNTYLVLNGEIGADPSYDYGTHFLFQGHESGAGYITRINLDADYGHRVTRLASTLSDGTAIPAIDGSTWDPFAKRLLLTSENASAAEMQATANYPSTVDDISGVIGRGGYEGIQVNSLGQIWIVEDVGGGLGTVNNKAKQPNSFIYRFLPTDIHDLTAGGRLQVLQVISNRSGDPIVFHAGQADADILSPDRADLHTYGQTFQTRWITIHDTATDGTDPYQANDLAKAAGGTPFKRPENGVFQPDTEFRKFFFTETGDTDTLSQAGARYGSYGAIYEVSLPSAGAANGHLKLFYLANASTMGLDNIQFLTRGGVVAVQDAGDTAHTENASLDSAWLFQANVSYGSGALPTRIIAEGRDPSATLDSELTGTGNEGDNEITGFHVSNGDPSAAGLLGAAAPNPFHQGWRVFWTQQHGDNYTWEILPNP
jgi:hypothetical protein